MLVFDLTPGYARPPGCSLVFIILPYLLCTFTNNNPSFAHTKAGYQKQTQDGGACMPQSPYCGQGSLVRISAVISTAALFPKEHSQP